MQKTGKVVLWLGKAVFAGIVAFGILNIFAYFYYYIPFNVECTTGATDYVLPANFKGYNKEEGFAKIQIDGNGYNNETTKEKIDVLCMGSSHTLGYNVDTDKNYVSLLNKESGNMYFYNIGMFGHEWYYCMNHLEAALHTFQPSKYVVMETFYSKYDIEKLELLNSGSYGAAGAVTSDFMQEVKKVPYFQLAMHQLKNMMAGNEEEQADWEAEETPKEDLKGYKEQLSIALQRAKQLTADYGCQLVFLYNPTVLVDNTGRAYADTRAEYFSIFEELCQENGIMLVDMTEDFLAAYKQEYILPRGFENTQIGSGHINRYGHKMIADKLYQVLEEDVREE